MQGKHTNRICCELRLATSEMLNSLACQILCLTPFHRRVRILVYIRPLPDSIHMYHIFLDYMTNEYEDCVIPATKIRSETNKAPGGG